MMRLAWSKYGAWIFDVSRTLRGGQHPSLTLGEINAEISRLSARVAELKAENAGLREQIEQTEGYGGIAHDFETVKAENTRLRKAAEKTVDAYCPICVNKGNLSSDRGCGACVIFGLRATLVQP